MPGFADLPATLTAMYDLVRTIPGIQSVKKGVPEAFSTVASSFVALGGGPLAEEATQVYRRERGLLVTFGYLVRGAEATAEERIAGFVDEFEARVLTNRTASVTGNSVTVTAMLNGTVESMNPPESLGDDPEYRAFVGQEFRLYPFRVAVHHRGTYG